MTDRPGDIELKLTDDGSHTLFIHSLNENYHSWHGAHTESLYVYIENGLQPALEKKEEINILEVGLGTGLNAMLTLEHLALNPEKKLHYTGIEKYPLPADIITGLNYKERFDPSVQPFFDSIHSIPPATTHQFLHNFSFTKIHGGIEEFSPDRQYDLIYFDAFAPSKQPEIWQAEIFQKLYRNMNPGGMMVTYCAQGEFKRKLAATGFQIEILPGPPGKREMTRACKP